MLMWVSPYWIAQFLDRMVMPAFFRYPRVHDPFCHLLVFTEGAGLAQELVDEVVLPWSTWAMIAMLRMARDMGLDTGKYL